MGSNHSPPSCDVPLISDEGKLPELGRKHKAAILYFIFLAELDGKNADKKDGYTSSVAYAQYLAGVFLKVVYYISVDPGNIQTYYEDVRAKIEAAGKWDGEAIMNIMSLREQSELKTLDEILCFSKEGSKYMRSFSKSKLALIHKSTEEISSDSTGLAEYNPYWEEDVRARIDRSAIFRDLKLPKIVSNDGFFCSNPERDSVRKAVARMIHKFRPS